MISHCVTSFRKNQKERAFRTYVTDALKVIAENTARYAGGSTMTLRYVDIMEPKKETEEKTTESVVSHLRKKLE